MLQLEFSNLVHRSVIGTDVSRPNTNHIMTSAFENHDQQTKRRRLEDDSQFLPVSRSTDSNSSQTPLHNSRLSITTANSLSNYNPSSSPLFSTPTRVSLTCSSAEFRENNNLLSNYLINRIQPSIRIVTQKIMHLNIY